MPHRRVLIAREKRSNAWHDANKGTLSFKFTPGPEKLERILNLLGCRDAMAPYLVSDNWVEVELAERVESELVDLSVEETHSFIGNGLVNHNSIVCLDKIVAHCYLEHDALFTIIGNAHRALAEGVCNDLVSFTLPRWRDGNREPPFIRQNGVLVPNPREGELIDHGIGLEFSSWKSDPNNKDLYLKIRNQFDGWSRIRVIAIPYAEMVQARVTNLNASGVYLEEATRCDGPDYYKWPALQLYRRRGIKGTQPFLFSCNPDDPCTNEEEFNDPKRWVYRWMYKDSVVAKSQPGREWPNDPEKPGIRRDPQVAFYTLPYRENEHNVSQKNREIVERTLKADPVARARLLKGKWVAQPKGDALFKGQFVEARHMHGDAEKKRGLVPVRGFPIVIGMDWGSQSVGIVFRQVLETKEGPFKLTIDSLSYHQEMHTTRALARALLEKMRFWNEWLRDELRRGKGPEAEEEIDPHAEEPEGEPGAGLASWCWWFITGDDATTNWNPESGNIHARDLQDNMQAVLEEDPQRYAGIDVPVIRGCPRPPGSKEKRAEIVKEDLMTDMSAISAICEDVKGMYFNLPRDKENPSSPAKGNRWIHIHDASSYIDYYRRFVLPGGFYIVQDGDAVSIA
jgi:hypothetical protein